MLKNFNIIISTLNIYSEINNICRLLYGLPFPVAMFWKLVRGTTDAAVLYQNIIIVIIWDNYSIG